MKRSDRPHIAFVLARARAAGIAGERLLRPVELRLFAWWPDRRGAVLHRAAGAENPQFTFCGFRLVQAYISSVRGHQSQPAVDCGECLGWAAEIEALARGG